MITFTIPGNPVAKGRARSFIRNGRIGHHTPEKTVNYESLVALAAQSAMKGGALMDGPVQLYVAAHFAIPKSWSNKRREANRTTPEWVTKKPDMDNLAKSICDGMNGVVWVDDSQVAALSGIKIYADTPCVRVTVTALEAV